MVALRQQFPAMHLFERLPRLGNRQVGRAFERVQQLLQGPLLLLPLLDLRLQPIRISGGKIPQ